MINNHAENSGTDLHHLEGKKASGRDLSKNTHLRLQGQASCPSCFSHVIHSLCLEAGKFSKVNEDCQGGGRGPSTR